MIERPRLRDDLLAERCGDGTVEVMAPEADDVLELYDVEMAIACAMDGKRDALAIVTWAQRELGLETTPAEVRAVIAALADAGCLLVDKPVAKPVATPVVAPAAPPPKPKPLPPVVAAAQVDPGVAEFSENVETGVGGDFEHDVETRVGSYEPRDTPVTPIVVPVPIVRAKPTNPPAVQPIAMSAEIPLEVVDIPDPDSLPDEPDEPDDDGFDRDPSTIAMPQPPRLTPFAPQRDTPRGYAAAAARPPGAIDPVTKPRPPMPELLAETRDHEPGVTTRVAPPPEAQLLQAVPTRIAPIEGIPTRVAPVPMTEVASTVVAVPPTAAAQNAARQNEAPTRVAAPPTEPATTRRQPVRTPPTPMAAVRPARSSSSPSSGTPTIRAANATPSAPMQAVKYAATSMMPAVTRLPAPPPSRTLRPEAIDSPTIRPDRPDTMELDEALTLPPEDEPSPAPAPVPVRPPQASKPVHKGTSLGMPIIDLPPAPYFEPEPPSAPGLPPLREPPPSTTLEGMVAPKRCTSCGTDLLPGYRFCMSCGMPVAAAAADGPEPMPEPPEPPEPYVEAPQLAPPPPRPTPPPTEAPAMRAPVAVGTTPRAQSQQEPPPPPSQVDLVPSDAHAPMPTAPSRSVLVPLLVIVGIAALLAAGAILYLRLG